MKGLEHKNLERVRYWQGQLLRSSDFREIAEVEVQRRWWHNRAIHQAYGVRHGFQLKLTGTPRHIVVSPGVAYDCFGRELVLDRPQAVPFPVSLRVKKGTRLSLLIRYSATGLGSRQAQCSGSVCLAECVYTTGTVEFFWMPSAAVTPVEGVALGALLGYSSQSQISSKVVAETVSDESRLDPAFQPFMSRALARPLLISDTTVAANTAWVPWTMPFVVNEAIVSPLPIGVQAVIDTSACGFTAVPCYFASLQGATFDPKSLSLLPSLYTSVSDETPTSFTFNILLQDVQQDSVLESALTGTHLAPGLKIISDPAAFLLFAQQQELFVRWTACQMLHVSAPALDESRAIDEIISSVLLSNYNSVGVIE